MKRFSKFVQESIELDEVSDKKLDAYRQKAFADQPAGDDGSDKYRKRKFGRDLAFAKQTGRAKVLATKEEVELDEAKLSQSQRDRLDDLILNVHMTTHPEYDGDEEPTKYLNMIRKEFGDKVAKQVDDGIDKEHWGRDNHTYGSDKLSWRKGNARITKSGKMNAQDVNALKNRIKRDKAWGGITKKVKLPEAVELDELSAVTLGKYSQKARTDALDHSGGPWGKKKDPARVAKRLSGDAMAVKKLDKIRKEEVDLDEAPNQNWADKEISHSREQERLAKQKEKTMKAKNAASRQFQKSSEIHAKTAKADHDVMKARRGQKIEEVELDQETQYEIVESYLLENNIDVDSLTEEELNELIGKVVGGAFKLGAKAITGAAKRMSTSGRADAAEKRAAAAEKKNKDRERIRKAQERLRAARAAST